MGDAGVDTGQTPDAWLGMLVEILLVTAYPGDEEYRPGPLTAEWESGILNEVNDRGIVAALSGDGDDPQTLEGNDPQTFFPWSAVLRMRVAST